MDILLHFCQYRLSDQWGGTGAETEFKSFILTINIYTDPALSPVAGLELQNIIISPRVKTNYM
jgi:hypothetical protein